MTTKIPTQLRTAAEAKSYMLGGRAIITLTSQATNKFLTYKITVKPEKPDMHFVWVHTSLGYKFVCTLKPDKKIVPGGMSTECLDYKAFVWAWRHIANNSMPKKLAVYHNNTCCRCGRDLTTPKSMAAGVGPECIKHM